MEGTTTPSSTASDPRIMGCDSTQHASVFGADVKTLQMQLGHSSPSITLNTYTALWPERLDDVADAVGAFRERELG